MRGRDVYPVKYYSKEGFVEHKIELDDDDLAEIIEEYLLRHADFDIDEVEIVNNRPMNIWLYALLMFLRILFVFLSDNFSSGFLQAA